jgi:hypothetical protein
VKTSKSSIDPEGAIMTAQIPAAWLPKAKMVRIIVHWTAGGHKATATDRKHYHLLREGDGKLVRGIPSIAANQAPLKKGYAAHTLNCNSGSIGVSMCCMAGAKERPFDAGKAPMTRVQWDAMVGDVAQLARHYDIPVTRETVLSHAEVQTNLGIKQRGKWDIRRLAFDPDGPQTARACGDLFRAAVLRWPVSASAPAKVAVPKPVADDKATVTRVQERLAKLGYHEVGAVDGLGGKRTSAAILAFRLDHGLALTTAIDDALLAALMTAPPREIAPERATATAVELRDKGSSIMSGAAVQQGAGVAVAGGAVAEGVAKSGVLDTLTDSAETVSQVTDALSPFQSLLAFVGDYIWVAFAAIGGVVVWQAIKIAKARLADHRSGKTSAPGGAP